MFLAPFEDVPSSSARIYLFNDELLDCPHIMLRNDDFLNKLGLPEGTYRWICLFEHNSVVYSLVPYEEKIRDAIDRLVELLSMNKAERNREYQKEFMFYWNNCSSNGTIYTAYLSQEESFAEMQLYYSKGEARIVEKGLILSDNDDRLHGDRVWTQHIENDVFYIPISDSREILPPTRGYKWTASDIQNIVYGDQIEHIHNDSFQMLKNCIPKTQNIILLFGMKTEQINVVFAARVKCNNRKGHTLMEKIISDIIDVEPLITHRKDYLYLCEQIGNDIGLMKKHIMLIGAGSLGSYVAFELVKNGANHLTVYDGDTLEEENVLRWSYGGFCKGRKKVQVIKTLLEFLHPEIIIEAHEKFIDTSTLIGELSGIDMIIVTIGSSDDQLELNKALKKVGCSVPVLYIWLEAGGCHSHILYVDYRKKGCYECLYTDSNGNIVNNRAIKGINNDSANAVIRNGCGGARAAYGTAILLRTTAALLDVIKDINKYGVNSNRLIDISPDMIAVSETEFPMEACRCCGDSTKQ